MTVRNRTWALALGLTTAGLLAIVRPTTHAQAGDGLPATIEFNRDIRPILSDKCYKCHGPGTQAATLRFDKEEEAKHELRGGRFAIVPGDPSKSEIVRRITQSEPARRMPQQGEPLTDREIGLIRRWIEQGATWQNHWAFIAPRRPDLPALKNRTWARNPIDAFVLTKLELEGLTPSPEADRPTWLRRVTLDLTGLPPTIAEVDAFVADRSSTAYERQVDRLLQSPRYGERMAFPWLEAARYADSNGYQSDGERHMWRWRDWVIEAFNRNMPFDEFAIEQLAGDLLPNATLDQRIATGFNRNHRGNSEGGIIPEEYAAEYVIDRVDTTSTVFLGLTAGCARCHNHKYDPLTQKQYYQLFSYFNNVAESGKARRQGNSPPFIKAPTAAQQPQLRQLDERLAAAADAFTKLQPALTTAQRSWERTLGNTAQVAWGPARGLVAHYPLDGALDGPVSVTRDGKPVPLGFKDGPPQFSAGRIGQAASFDGRAFIQGGDVTGFESHGFFDDPYSLSVWIFPTAPTGAIVTKVNDAVEPNGHGLQLSEGKVQYNYVSKWLDEGIRVQTERTVTLNQWHHLTLAYDGSRYAEGVMLYVDGVQWKWEVLLDDLNNPRPLRREPLRIGGGGGPRNRFQGQIDDVRIYNRDLSAAEARVLADSMTISEIVALPLEQRTEAQADKIRDYFLEHDAPANIRAAWNGWLDARAKRDEFYASLPTVMVMEEMKTPRISHVLNRGVYDAPGDQVTPALPDFLVSPAENYAPNRLGLARWVVNPSNPLTARVTVNRFWQMYFGTGIVKTSEDFGSQGEAPSHPELLDWLATEFIRSGWNVKALQKLIVTSATYRQSSLATPEMAQKDPENRLLARGPNVRLSAPVIRDQALAVAGLLVNTIGGPSVYPYQPAGLWHELNSYEEYALGHGADLYRRSLYTFWKRSVPPPTMANFDASSRESCVVRQTLTNTPLQALDLMNNPTYVEAARVLAQRMMHDGGARLEDRVVFAFRLATARRPKPAELAILVDAYRYYAATFTGRPDAALKYVGHGESPRDARLNVSELAAYTSVASLILNFNHTVVKD